MDQNAVQLQYDLAPSPQVASRLQRQMQDLERNLRFKGPFGPAAREVRDFGSELDRANQRVITLGASFAVLATGIKTLKDIVRSTIEVEKAFTEINAVFGLSAKGLDTFSKQLFSTARDTAQSFDKAANAAKEFSRQGLTAEETIKRTRDALILTRLANLDVAKSVETLTASINGFQKSALTSSEIVNKLATVDAKFAVSSADLAEALARSGAAASDAGVSFDQLIGIVTAAQQTTARGGAVIGNSLKTIFTRIERRDTIDAFESLGVQVRDSSGAILGAIPLLQNFSKVYDKLNGSLKKQAAEMVGGVYQINILKAVLGDLAKAQGIAAQATDISSNATDEAIKRNQMLNQSLDAMLTKLSVTAKQIGANIGGQSFAGPLKSLLSGLLDNDFTRALEDATGKADTAGGKFAQEFLQGFGNTIVYGLGPLVAVALSKIAFRNVKGVFSDFGDLTGLSSKRQDQARVEAEIVGLYRAGGAALQQQLAAMSSLTEKAALLQRLLAQTAANPNSAASMASVMVGQGYRGRKFPRAAGGYVPMAEEAAMISRGVGGAPAGAKPVYLPTFNRGGGQRGIVANTSERIVNMAGGSAIFNEAMIQKMGLPPGSKPVAAGGHIPNAAFGSMMNATPYGYPYNYPGGGGGGFGPGAFKGPIIPGGGTPGATGQGFGQYVDPVASASGLASKVMAEAVASTEQALQAAAAETRAQREKDFAKARGEADSQNHEEENLLKRRQAAEEAAARRKATEIEKLWKIHDREEGLINRRTALTALEMKWVNQAQSAMESVRAIWAMEAQAKGSAIRTPIEEAARAQRGKDAYTKWATERDASANQPSSGRLYQFYNPLTQAAPGMGAALRGPTYAETVLKKDLRGLTNNQLSSLIGISGGFGPGQTGTRSDAVQSIRGELVRNPKNIGQDQIATLIGFGRSGTLYTQFADTVKRQMTAGETLESAYAYASREFKDAGGSARQLSKAQVTLLGGLLSFEKDLKDNAQQAAEQRRLVVLENKQRAGNISRQATLNAANMRIQGGDSFTSLTREQRAALVNQLRQNAIEKLGYGGHEASEVLRNSAARQQINAMIAPELAMLRANNGGGATPPVLSRGPSAWQRMRNSFSSPGAALGITMAAPFAAGLLPEYGGGTAGGRVTGALGGGLNGLALGATMGSIIPGVGTGIGAALGGAVGALTGFLSKFRESFDEMSQRLEKTTDAVRQEMDDTLTVIRLRREVAEAREGGRPKEARRLEDEMANTLGRIRDPEFRSFLRDNRTNPEAASDFVTGVGGGKLSAVSAISGMRRAFKLSESSIVSPTFNASSTYGTSLSGEFDVPMLARAVAAPASPSFDKDSAEKAANELRGLISKLPDIMLANLVKHAGEDPMAAMRSVGQMSGLGNAEVEASMQRMNPAFAQYAVARAAQLALEANYNRKDAIGPNAPTNELRSGQIRGISSGLRFRSGLADVRFDSQRRIADVAGRVRLGNPSLSELDALVANQDLDISNIRATNARARGRTVDLGVADLVETIRSQGVTNKSVFPKIEGLANSRDPLGDLVKLQQALSADKKPEDLGGVYSEQVMSQLQELINSLKTLKVTEDEQIATAKESTRILQQQLLRSRTLAGAQDEDTGRVTRAREAFLAARDRNESPQAIEQSALAYQLEIANQARRNGSVTFGGQTFKVDQAGVDRLNLLGRRRIGDNLAQDERDAVLRAAAEGSDLIGGSDIEGALFGNAARAGRRGDTKGSFLGGFRAVMDGAKRDLADFSRIGAQTADNLIQGATDFWTSWTTGAAKGKDAFKGFVASVLSDASRMLASKAFTAAFSAIPGFSGFGNASGGRLGFAAGGMVPAMLTGGEFVFGPKAAKQIGYDTLRRMNGYNQGGEVQHLAGGGMVRGGSGVKDDVPANLPSGSFVIRKSAVQKLGPQYLQALAAGQVQHRFLGGLLGTMWGGALAGGVVGGGLGYLAGGKKGALGGALLGAIGGGLYGWNAGNSAMAASGAGSGAAVRGAIEPTLSIGTKAALGLGAAAGLGLLAGGVTRDTTPGPVSVADVAGFRDRHEAFYADQMARDRKIGQHAFLQVNPQGGYSLAGFDMAPATRRWADGGGVDLPLTPMPSSSSGGSGGTVQQQVSVRIEINNQGGISSTSEGSGGGVSPEAAGRLEKMVRGWARDELVQQSRSDGFFTQRSRYMNA